MSNLNELIKKLENLRATEKDTFFCMFVNANNPDFKLHLLVGGDHKQSVIDLANLMMIHPNLKNLIHDVAQEYESFDNDLNNILEI